MPKSQCPTILVRGLLPGLVAILLATLVLLDIPTTPLKAASNCTDASLLEAGFSVDGVTLLYAPLFCQRRGLSRPQVTQLSRWQVRFLISLIGSYL